MKILKLDKLFNDEYEDIEYTHIIYRIHNLITDKSYIGETKYSSIKTRFLIKYQNWYGSHQSGYESDFNKHLYNSMKKYGIKNFNVEILYTSDTYDVNLEEKFINEYDSYFNGYNDSPHGKTFGFGSTVKGRIRIIKDNKVKLIKPNQLPRFKKKGWTRGSTKYDWATDGITEIQIPKNSEVPEGFRLGRLTNEYLMNEKRLKNAHSTQIENKIGIFSDSHDRNSKKAQETMKSNNTGFYNKELQLSIKKNIPRNRIIKTIERVKSLGLELNEETYNSNRYINGTQPYDRAITDYPELFKLTFND